MPRMFYLKIKNTFFEDELRFQSIMPTNQFFAEVWTTNPMVFSINILEILRQTTVGKPMNFFLFQNEATPSDSAFLL